MLLVIELHTEVYKVMPKMAALVVNSVYNREVPLVHIWRGNRLDNNPCIHRQAKINK